MDTISNGAGGAPLGTINRSVLMYSAPEVDEKFEGVVDIEKLDEAVEQLEGEIQTTKEELEQEIDDLASHVAKVFKFKGVVDSYDDLPVCEDSTDSSEACPNEGDVYEVKNGYVDPITGEEIPPGTNWAWNGEKWDPLGGDMSDYLLKETAAEMYATKESLTAGLAGKADKADAALAPIYSQTPTFSEWTFSDVSDGITDIQQPVFTPPSTGEPLWSVSFDYDDETLIARIYSGDEDATNLAFVYSDEGLNLHLTATRTRTDILGYRLGPSDGPNADKPLQPAGAYQKPSGGIPATDMAQAVQDSLQKADDALSRKEVEAGFTEWVMPDGAESRYYVDYFSNSWFLRNISDDEPIASKSAPADAVIVTFSEDWLIPSPLTITRTRLPTMADLDDKASLSSVPSADRTALHALSELDSTTDLQATKDTINTLMKVLKALVPAASAVFMFILSALGVDSLNNMNPTNLVYTAGEVDELVYTQALSRIEAEAGFTEWEMPDGAESRYYIDYFEDSGWILRNVSDGEPVDSKIAPQDATNVTFNQEWLIPNPLTITRTRLRPTPEMEASWDAKQNVSRMASRAIPSGGQLQDPFWYGSWPAIDVGNNTNKPVMLADQAYAFAMYTNLLYTKASTNDVKLASIYSEPPTFSEWVCNNPGLQIDYRDGVWGLVTPDGEDWFPSSETDPDATIFSADVVGVKYTATRTRTDIIGYTLGNQTNSVLASTNVLEKYATTNDVAALASDLEALQFKEWFPDGTVTSYDQCTTNLKYTVDANGNAWILPFCNTGTAANDNSDIVGNVVIPPYVVTNGATHTVIGVLDGDYDDTNTNLTTITLPTTAKHLGAYSFTDCASLTSLSLPGVSVIDDVVFADCTALSHVSSHRITTINIEAFTGCSSLTYLNFGNSLTNVPSLSSNAFEGVPTTCRFIVPDNLYTNWITAPGWSDLVSEGYQFTKYSGNYLKDANGIYWELTIGTDGTIGATAVTNIANQVSQ